MLISPIKYEGNFHDENKAHVRIQVWQDDLKRNIWTGRMYIGYGSVSFGFTETTGSSDTEVITKLKGEALSLKTAMNAVYNAVLE